MESDDRTVEIARSFGARVLSHPREAWVEPARQFGIAQCQGNWILIVDADEMLPPSLARKLQEISRGDDADIVWLPRRNIWFGKWLRHGVTWPDPYPRFFRPGAQTIDHRLHSKPVPAAGARSVRLPAEERYALVHVPGETLADAAAKTWRYAAIGAADLHKDGGRFGWLSALRSVAREFVGRLVVRQAFRDGREGVVVALMDGLIYPVLTWLRLWELESGDKHRAANEGVREALLQEWNRASR